MAAAHPVPGSDWRPGVKVDPLTVYPCLEWALAEEIGFPAESVVHARCKLLHRGADWDRVRGRIRLTAQARIRLLEVLKPAALNSAPNTVTPAAPEDTAGTTEPFPHAEAELGTRLGLGEKNLRQLRAEVLKRGVDWDLVKGGVCLPQTGLGRLLEATGLPASTPVLAEVTAASATQAAPSARQIGAQEELVCFKCYKLNRRMLEAKTAAGDLVLVSVRDNSNFLPGMTMKCRFAGTRVWELAQRLPRHRGRW